MMIPTIAAPMPIRNIDVPTFEVGTSLSNSSRFVMNSPTAASMAVRPIQ